LALDCRHRVGETVDRFAAQGCRATQIRLGCFDVAVAGEDLNIRDIAPRLKEVGKKSGAEPVGVCAFDFSVFPCSLDDFVEMGIAFAANCWKHPTSPAWQEIQRPNKAVAHLDVALFPSFGRELLFWFCGDPEQLLFEINIIPGEMREFGR
jgi:hypothetical protein